MNADEWQAGREMDAWIAVNVMELPKVELGGACPKCHGETRLGIDRAWCYACGEWIYSPYLEYSSDIAAAFQALERFPAYAISHSHDAYQCRIYTDKLISRGERMALSDADTAPLAICRAMRKAVVENA